MGFKSPSGLYVYLTPLSPLYLAFGSSWSPLPTLIIQESSRCELNFPAILYVSPNVHIWDKKNFCFPNFKNICSWVHLLAAWLLHKLTETHTGIWSYIKWLYNWTKAQPMKIVNKLHVLMSAFSSGDGLRMWQRGGGGWGPSVGGGGEIVTKKKRFHISHLQRLAFLPHAITEHDKTAFLSFHCLAW